MKTAAVAWLVWAAVMIAAFVYATEARALSASELDTTVSTILGRDVRVVRGPGPNAYTHVALGVIVVQPRVHNALLRPETLGWRSFMTLCHEMGHVARPPADLQALVPHDEAVANQWALNNAYRVARALGVPDARRFAVEAVRNKRA